MKRVFVAAAFFLFISGAKAQSDTSRVTITLKARHHAYLIAFMGDRGSVDRIRYVTQVASQVSDTADKEKPVTVVVTESLIRSLYVTIGSQPERLTTIYNAEIKAALLPQVVGRPKLIAALGQFAQQNSSETTQMVQSGFQFINGLRITN